MIAIVLVELLHSNKTSVINNIPAAVIDTPTERALVLPDRALTPGVVASSDAKEVCAAGYASRVRPRGALWRRLKDGAYSRYGIERGKRSILGSNGMRYPAYEVDHLIPLELGGDPVDPRNLWPEPIVSAKDKDVVENELHARVCGAQMTLEAAQRLISTDWQRALTITDNQ
jgi:hypothetical protein